MKIEKFEDLVPYIGRVVIGWWYREDEEKEYTYIDNITTYIKKAADGLGINYDSLYNDLKSNLMYYYSDSYQGPMKSEEELTHVIDDARTLWLTEVVYNEDGSIGRKDLKKVYPRLDLSILYDIPFSEKKKVKGELKPRKNYGKGKGNMNLKDSVLFFSEPDSSTVISQSTYFWDDPVQSLFTTEEEAKSYIESVKPKEKKKPKVKKAYEKFLTEAEKLGADQIQELIGELEKLYDNKIDELDLDPLQVALTYQDKADQVDSFIIEEGSSIRDWIDEHMDPNRYETVEYGNILEWILDNYDEGVEWKDIKEEDQEVITEIAEELRGGCKGFKWDW